MAIERLGRGVVSFTGSQAGIITDDAHGRARIVELRVGRLSESLAKGKIVLVAGFQGVSRDLNITTLGRGGSDTTAVALAGELKASVCEIYTDVDGVYTANPSFVADAHRVPEISYEEMLELTAAGAEVLAQPCVERALREHVHVHVRSSFSDEPGTWVRASLEKSHSPGICGVTYSEGEVCIELPWDAESAPTLLGAFRESHGLLTDLGVEAGEGGQIAQLICFCRQDDFSAVERRLSDLLGRRADRCSRIRTDVARVSVVGRQASNDPVVAARMLDALQEWRLSGVWLAPSGLRASCAVPVQTVEVAVSTLHTAFFSMRQ